MTAQIKHGPSFQGSGYLGMFPKFGFNLNKFNKKDDNKTAFFIEIIDGRSYITGCH